MYKGKERQILDYLSDIIESISDIREFVAGLDYENFLTLSGSQYTRTSMPSKPE